jgi:hypothetical protein
MLYYKPMFHLFPVSSPRRLVALLVAAALCGCALADPLTRKVYYIGNSVTDEIGAGDWANYGATLASLGDSHDYGRHIIPGASIKWIWEHPADGFQRNGHYPAALANLDWHGITLQPFDGTINQDVDFGTRFIDLARNRKPDTVTYVYARWPKIASGVAYETSYLAAAPSPGSISAAINGKAFMDEVYLGLKAARPAADIRMIPVNTVFHEANERMKAGLFPGYTYIHQLYDDNVHVNGLGSYLAACTFYATIYGKDPAGLSHSGYPGVTPAQAALAQEIAWQVVTAHPYTGVQTNLPLAVGTTALPAAVLQQPYSATLTALRGAPPYVFTLQSGALPAGLALSGPMLAGTPSAAGSFPLVFRVTDSLGASAEASLTLSVAASAPLALSVTTLSAGTLGRHLSANLGPSGGVAPYAWSVIDGALPPGVAFENGVLSGAPLRSGAYAFTVRLADSAQPVAQTLDRAFALTVQPAPATTYQAPYTATAPVIDGVLDAGWTLSESLPRGAEAPAASFAAKWTPDALYIVARFTETSPVTAPGDPAAGNALEVFFDAGNNDEATYNFDDRHFILGLDGALAAVGDSAGLERAVGVSGDTVTIELRLPFANLDLAPAVGRALGFDLARRSVASPGAGPTRSFWHGDAGGDADPTRFGKLLLAADPAGSQTATIDFESLSAQAGGSAGTVLTLGSHEFRALADTTAQNINVRGVAQGYSSVVIVPQNNSNRIVLRRTDGGAFSLAGFQHAAAPWGASADVIVRGTPAAGGATLSAGPHSTGTRAGTTITLGWGDLSSVEFDWAGGASETLGAIDNLVIGQPAEPPLLLAQPGDAALPEGDALSLVASASGSAPMAWRWQKRAGDQWGDIPGATTATLGFTTVLQADAGLYRAVVGNPAGVAVTRTAVVVVEPLLAGFDVWSASVNWAEKDSEPLADPDGDGVVNFLEYALAGAPLVADATALPRVEVLEQPAGGPWLALTYRRPQSAEDLIYTVRKSVDLVNWSDLVIDAVQAHEDVLENEPGAGTTLRRVRVPLGGERLFLRLRVARTAP